jgi:hypothetical protein
MHALDCCCPATTEDTYGWTRRITVDPILINQIIGLRMQGPDPQEFYLGKTVDCALAQ